MHALRNALRFGNRKIDICCLQGSVRPVRTDRLRELAQLLFCEPRILSASAKLWSAIPLDPKVGYLLEDAVVA
jgi:hypothetical protein